MVRAKAVLWSMVSAGERAMVEGIKSTRVEKVGQEHSIFISLFPEEGVR